MSPSPWRTSSQAAEKSGRPVGPGTAVIAWTGADRVWAQEGFATDRPYIPVETGQWLIDQKVDLFATDLIGMDITEVHLPPGASAADREEAEGFFWPFHTLMLTAGICMVQQLCNLDQLVGEEFLLVVLPLKMRGGTGSPVRPVALVVLTPAQRSKIPGRAMSRAPIADGRGRLAAA